MVELLKWEGKPPMTTAELASSLNLPIPAVKQTIAAAAADPRANAELRRRINNQITSGRDLDDNGDPIDPTPEPEPTVK